MKDAVNGDVVAETERGLKRCRQEERASAVLLHSVTSATPAPPPGGPKQEERDAAIKELFSLSIESI